MIGSDTAGPEHVVAVLGGLFQSDGLEGIVYAAVGEIHDAFRDVASRGVG